MGERTFLSCACKNCCSNQLRVETWTGVWLDLRAIKLTGACHLTFPLYNNADYIQQTRTSKGRSRSVYEPMKVTVAPAC